MAVASLLDPETLRRATDLSRPVVLAKDQLLPVAKPFRGFFPDGGMRRGSSVCVQGAVGSTSLGLGLVAEASRSGSWTAVVAMPWLGLVAAEEYGLDLTRTAIIDDIGDQWATIVAALVGAFDVILTSPPVRMRSSDGRRLAARMRERGTVMVQVDGRRYGRSRRSNPIAGDVSLTTGHCDWEGLEVGHGRLVSRRIEVTLGGRGAAGRGRSEWMWLPNRDGVAESVVAEQVASIAPGQLINSPAEVHDRLRHLNAVPDICSGRDHCDGEGGGTATSNNGGIPAAG